MKRNKLIFNSTIAFILLITVILCEEWSKKKSEMIDQTSFFFDYGTETAAFEAEFASTPFGEYEQVKIQVEQVEQWENGILYTMMIESDTEDDSRYFYGRDRFFLGYFYVSEDKIYRIDENKMEEVNIKNEECEFPYKSRVMGTSEPLKPLKAPYMARNPVKWGFFRLKGQEIPLKI